MSVSAEFAGNARSFSQRSNVIAGSNTFNIVPFYLQTLSIPGINFSLPEIGGRWGTKIVLNSDNVSFDSLTFTVLVDEGFTVYDELMKIAKSQLDNDTGILTDKTFEFWIAVTDNKGNDVIKWTFQNTKLESIGEIQYDYTSDETQFTMDVSMKFDNYDYHLMSGPSAIPSLKI